MAGEQFVVDIDNLELGEVEAFEDAMGCTIGEADLESAKAIIRLIWVVKKREDPKFTLDKARKIKVSQLGDGNGVPPTPAAPKSKPAAAGRRKSGKQRA